MRVKGHTLRSEGAAYRRSGRRSAESSLRFWCFAGAWLALMALAAHVGLERGGW